MNNFKKSSLSCTDEDHSRLVVYICFLDRVQPKEDGWMIRVSDILPSFVAFHVSVHISVYEEKSSVQKPELFPRSFERKKNKNKNEPFRGIRDLELYGLLPSYDANSVTAYFNFLNSEGGGGRERTNNSMSPDGKKTHVHCASLDK